MVRCLFKQGNRLLSVVHALLEASGKAIFQRHQRIRPAHNDGIATSLPSVEGTLHTLNSFLSCTKVSIRRPKPKIVQTAQRSLVEPFQSSLVTKKQVDKFLTAAEKKE